MKITMVQPLRSRVLYYTVDSACHTWATVFRLEFFSLAAPRIIG
jgi:hypothetical protein